MRAITFRPVIKIIPPTETGLFYNDGNGNIIRTENELDPNNYPSTIGGYYTKHYPNEEYIIWMSEDNTGKRSYYTIRNNERIWFDENGNYMVPQTTEKK